VRLKAAGFESDGWTLNISRGGARLIVEERVEPGEHYFLEVGISEQREVRIVWVQDEADGQVIGVQFLDVTGSIPDPPSAPTQSRPKRA
jgi:hypothetical protein